MPETDWKVLPSGFEDEGRGHEPGNSGGLEKLEKAGRRFSPGLQGNEAL